MKTRNNQTENTNNRFSQVVLRTAAVMASVVLLSFTVSAQDLWKELLSYNSFGKMALLMVNQTQPATETPATGAAASIAFAIDEETEAPLEVQNWMSNDSYFQNFEHVNEVAAEETMEIENWMTDEAYFNNRFAAEKEEARPVEAWMCDADFFGRK